MSKSSLIFFFSFLFLNHFAFAEVCKSNDLKVSYQDRFGNIVYMAKYKVIYSAHYGVPRDTSSGEVSVSEFNTYTKNYEQLTSFRVHYFDTGYEQLSLQGSRGNIFVTLYPDLTRFKGIGNLSVDRESSGLICSLSH